jgi:small-conductance mechanosensitive channel
VAMRASLRVPRALLWVWNVWGLWCLLAIAAIAVATSPMVRAFGDDPRHVNTWVLYFPYVWLPAVLVVVALVGHLVIARALVAGRTR